MELSATIRDYIRSHSGTCEVIPAPFAVNLNADDETYVEPDISVICDPDKLTDRECKGAPDFIIEIVSPSSRRMDYSTKNALYSNAGVREYWIVDPEKERTTVYRYEEDAAPTIIPFTNDIAVGIYESLSMNIAELLK
jgi:Uma2 family endonuclease